MKVWIVMENDYEDAVVNSVFDSKEKAEKQLTLLFKKDGYLKEGEEISLAWTFKNDDGSISYQYKPTNWYDISECEVE